MKNLNETTSIEILSDDELSLVGGGCSGKWQSYASYERSSAASSGGGNVAVVTANNLSINGSVIDDSVIFQDVSFGDNVQLVFANS